jgi:hypothetical protein
MPPVRPFVPLLKTASSSSESIGIIEFIAFACALAQTLVLAVL